jgi:hypothetical protein
VESTASAWFAEQPARGYVAKHENLQVMGFPNRFDLTVAGLELADPPRSIVWKLPFVQVFAMTWKPWHLIAALPTEQTVTLADQTLTLQSTRLMGSLKVIPGTDLGLNETVAEGEGLRLTSTLGWQVAADKMVVSTLLVPGAANRHRIGLLVTGFAPDTALARAAGLPDMISDIHLDARISLAAPLDRHSTSSNPAVTAIDLAAARLIWGDFKLFAKGSFTADPAGFAEGEVIIRIEKWRALPGLLAAMGLIAPDFAPTLEKGLEVMANAGADPLVLNLPLTASSGQMHLGPFPLGPAPMLYRQ